MSRHIFWHCNVCGAENHISDGECQYCDCGGLNCNRDNCSGDFCHGLQNIGACIAEFISYMN